MKSWAFFRSTGRVPSAAAFARLRAQTGWRKVRLNEAARTLLYRARPGARPRRHRQGLRGRPREDPTLTACRAFINCVRAGRQPVANAHVDFASGVAAAVANKAVNLEEPQLIPSPA